jgi:Site-specific recombinases, DNA invertase Pin homologs
VIIVFGAVAQLEREYIRQRQAEGIAIAVTQGKFKGRKPVEWDKYYKMIRDGAMTNVEAMKLMDLKKTTFYKLVKDYECNCN